MKLSTESIVKDNPYGYTLNINHPAVYPLYMRYKRWKGIPVWCPMSDEERMEFEHYLTAKGDPNAKNTKEQTTGTGD